MAPAQRYIRWFADLTADDVALAGGKNASLGEMIRGLRGTGIRVPDGFAVTADAYRAFVADNGLEAVIREQLAALRREDASLEQAGTAIRRRFQDATIPRQVADALREAYRELSARYATDAVDVAVRSSATAEDLPTASFAGQQDTYLNVAGEEALLAACRDCYASLFTDRAISYRDEQGFGHREVALSIGVQKMARADRGGAGVMFTIDPETGFPDVAVINAAWGLGEPVVQGAVTPDEYQVFKPLLRREGRAPIIGKTRGGQARKLVYTADGGAATAEVATSPDERRAFVLTDDEILQLARWGAIIEGHYGQPMDIEWAKDGRTGQLFIVQARPETVHSQKAAGALTTYTLREAGERLLTGLAIGEAIATGRACVIHRADERERFADGAILVTRMTDPDWVPIMKRAAGIITDHGGRTSHAAIVSRELGVPAVVGTGRATALLRDGQPITLSCAEGAQGAVYAGTLRYETTEVALDALPETKTRLMLNIASPEAALSRWQLPCRGVGLARLEFLITNVIKVHPLALVHFDDLTDERARRQIGDLTRGYADKTAYFVEHLARGIAKIAASRYPEPVLVRTSDFKTNEYAALIGGRQFEPEEENPMLGWRGASRYYSEGYREGFALECRAIKRAREEIGLDNVVVMIPFCRSLEEADRVLAALADNGLARGEHGLQVYVMCEIPANVVLAEQFAARFDGFSIGSNDLAQLTLGVDRDSTALTALFDERNEAVRWMIRHLIEAAHRADTPVGICGQAPSDYPDFAAWLVEVGIDSMSLNPDSVIPVLRHVAEVERRRA
ncbi:MAG TPA: phosphoenolpyruvate synthase [Thermomicrobiales bacterium]|nr:phosphoenolpyruvate synthase [Thermomicrobiales bacterium]